MQHKTILWYDLRLITGSMSEVLLLFNLTRKHKGILQNQTYVIKIFVFILIHKCPETQPIMYIK